MNITARAGIRILITTALMSCAGILPVMAQPSPSMGVKAYLAERHVLVAAQEIAVTRLEPPAGARDEIATLLQSANMTVKKEFGERATVLEAGALANPEFSDLVTQLGAHIGPVLKSRTSPLRVMPLQRVVFRLKDRRAVAEVLNDFRGLAASPLRPREYAVDLGLDVSYWSSLELAARLSGHEAVEWAVPDCIREARKNYLPDDADTQWHVHNTNAVTWTNDISLHRAWDTTLGDPSVVIAIMDDGIDLAHVDLSANIWTNPGEIVDGFDNDSNGYIDDINGWDFYKGSNSVAPDDLNEPHGTCVAGIAAARGNNSTGVCGVAPLCKLLSVKVYDGNYFVTDSQWADAVAYAARYAKVVNISSSIGDALDAQVESAYNNASTSSLIFGSAANDADAGIWVKTCTPYEDETLGWFMYEYSVAPGVFTCRWTYSKDSSESVGEDCAWLDGVVLPVGQREDFETASLPSGWSTGGDAPWFFSSSITDHVAVGEYSARSGPITHSESSWIQARVVGPGTLTFYYNVFGERYCNGGALGEYDVLLFSVNGVTLWDNAFEDPSDPLYGEDWTPVQFPAALTSLVAMGASSIDGFRAPYSCFNTNLDLLAPSHGSSGQTPIRTTDRTGVDGYTTTDYEDDFGGTSASAPIGAGVAALLFSANPHLTVHDARQLLRQSARKIGTITYDGNGFHERYGYGQIDAGEAMKLMLSNMPPNIVVQERNTDTVRFRVMGIETGRPYTVYRSTGWDGTNWNWAALSNSLGAPIWGTNTTPIMDIGNVTTHVYKIMK